MRIKYLIMIICLVVLPVYFFLIRIPTITFDAWPQDAINFAEKEMKRYMLKHDCDPEMEEIFNKDDNGDLKPIYRNEKKICKSNYYRSGVLDRSNAVSVFYRCVLEDRWGDYALTVFITPDINLGRSVCQYNILDKSLDLGETKNINLY